MSSNNNFTSFILSNSNRVKIVFVFLFIIFGLTIAFVSYFVNLYFENKNMKEELFNSAKTSFIVKENILIDRNKLFENILFSIRDSNDFKKYLESKDTRNSKDLFQTIMKINDELMQIRYLNKEGKEDIRINRKHIADKPYFTPENKLQNKSDRYYFKEVESLPEGKVWISKMDLNMEDGEIVKPFIPTIRLSTPVYKDNEFSGTIIINIFIKKLLKELTASDFFRISILDKDGEFISHFEKDSQTVKNYSWSRYLKRNYTLKNKMPFTANRVLVLKEFHQENIFSKSISSTFYNPDELIFLYEIKQEKLNQMIKKQNDYITIITLLVFGISIPIAFLLSIIPVKLSSELLSTQKELKDKQNTLDKYVAISTTDENGIITNVSSAFCNLTGYIKDELIGKNHNLLSSKDTSIELHKELWKDILTIGTWENEIKNINKKGEEFWVNLNINAIKDSDNQIIGFQSYMENITNNKLLYQSSITDSLTTLYNRRFFDEMFPRQIKISKREKTILYFCMMDVDFFKKFNDIYGHQAGDVALQKIANVFKKSLKRPMDYVFRLGGEEFGLLYSVNKKEDGFNIIKKIKQEVEELKIPHLENSASKFVTVSIGVYIIESKEARNVESIYKLCDEKLYKAKEGGRNTIII